MIIVVGSLLDRGKQVNKIMKILVKFILFGCDKIIGLYHITLRIILSLTKQIIMLSKIFIILFVVFLDPITTSIFMSFTMIM